MDTTKPARLRTETWTHQLAVSLSHVLAVKFQSVVQSPGFEVSLLKPRSLATYVDSIVKYITGVADASNTPSSTQHICSSLLFLN